MAESKPVTGNGILTEMGDSGLKRSWGLVQEEYLPQLQGDRAAKVYQEMADNDPIVGAVLYALSNLVRQVTWTVQGPNKSFVEDCLGDMSHTWEDFITEALSKLPYGWAFHEICYKERDDGRIGWKKLPLRSQDTLYRWDIDEHGGIHAFYQRTIDGHGCRIPIEKGLLFRTSSYKNNPEGRAVLRNAYRPWWFKKRIEEIEAIGIERDLAGIPVVGVPPEVIAAGAGNSVYDAFVDIVTHLRNDEEAGVVYPLAYDEHGNKLFTVELMSSSGRRQFVTGEVLMRYSQQIAMTCLADVILLGHERVGSFALSGSKEDLLATGLQSQVDEIGAVLNKHALPRLFALNGIMDTGTKIVPGELRAVNLKDLAEIVWKLTMSGMPFFPSEDFEAWIRALMDAPGKQGTEERVNPNTGAVGEDDGGDQGPDPAEDD